MMLEIMISTMTKNDEEQERRSTFATAVLR